MTYYRELVGGVAEERWGVEEVWGENRSDVAEGRREGCICRKVTESSGELGEKVDRTLRV